MKNGVFAIICWIDEFREMFEYASNDFLGILNRISNAKLIIIYLEYVYLEYVYLEYVYLEYVFGWNHLPSAFFVRTASSRADAPFLFFHVAEKYCATVSIADIDISRIAFISHFRIIQWVDNEWNSHKNNRKPEFPEMKRGVSLLMSVKWAWSPKPKSLCKIARGVISANCVLVFSCFPQRKIAHSIGFFPQCSFVNVASIPGACAANIAFFSWFCSKVPARIVVWSWKFSSRMSIFEIWRRSPPCFRVRNSYWLRNSIS